MGRPGTHILGSGGGRRGHRRCRGHRRACPPRPGSPRARTRRGPDSRQHGGRGQGRVGLADRHGHAGEIALDRVAADAAHPLELLDCLDAFGHDPHAGRESRRLRPPPGGGSDAWCRRDRHPVDGIGAGGLGLGRRPTRVRRAHGCDGALAGLVPCRREGGGRFSPRCNHSRSAGTHSGRARSDKPRRDGGRHAARARDSCDGWRP
jgi:hypothetical protein